jgi:hypothetical protein
MAFLFDDSCQTDGGQHYLFARWAWVHHELFVGVWSRPLFTTVYALPALFGYRAARLFTVLLCLLMSWQTWRLAADLQLQRAPLAIALLWLQPSFFLFCADTMTEPIFALVYVIALRLHHRGYVNAGMLTASLLILARPEGFFLGVLWGVWVLRERLAWVLTKGHLKSHFPAILKALAPTLLLATGAALWWLAALLITGDPLFIKHNWPPVWSASESVYGARGWLSYPSRLPEIVGLFLLPVFLYGLVWLLRQRRLGTLTSSFLLLFGLHTLMRAYGSMGSDGYPRYLVGIAPAIALITLAGWNQLAKFFAHNSRLFRTTSVALIIALSAYANFIYADGAEWSRDARALTVVHQWWEAQPDKPVVNRFIWSKAYADILFDRDPWENPEFTYQRAANIERLRHLPAGTLAMWEERVGPKWPGLRASDLEAAGFIRLHVESFLLRGYILNHSWFGFGGPRAQTIYLLYKPE